MKLATKIWTVIAILILLSPLGLFLPEHFRAGSAWGEWGIEEIKGLVGYLPEGLERLASIWNAPLPDYAFRGWEEKGLRYLSAAYIISAMLGAASTVIIIVMVGMLLMKRT